MFITSNVSRANKELLPNRILTIKELTPNIKFQLVGVNYYSATYSIYIVAFNKRPRFIRFYF